MDPDEALAALRAAIEEYGNEGYRDDVETEAAASAMVVASILEKFEALDEWMSKGGFPPAAWKGTR